ncbi:MAG TPA: S-layer homology domain-containing protein, partial [Syntrophomonadaceae bacterium]|nr:S-layer homology domain-containing protein [Syntrophomonadaceae bacterium]
GDTFPMPAANIILYARWTEQSSSSSGGDGFSPSPANSTTGQARVYPSQGGKISLGSDVVLNIPATALNGSSSRPVKIEKEESAPSLPSGFMLLGQVYSFSIDGQDHYQFNQPVTITFTFDPDKVPKGETPTVYYYDTSTSQWVSLPGTVSGHTITITVDHFTKFAVLAKAKADQPAEIKTNFTDISSCWAQEAIEKMAALGAVSGYADGSFKPNTPITRAEFVTMLVKALKLTARGNGPTFKDTAGHWASTNMSIATASGLISGYGDGYINPDSLITREEMAVIAVKAAKLPQSSGETAFTDNVLISSWAKDSMKAAVNANIMTGYPDNSIRPKGNTARAEAATVIMKLVK